MFLFTMVTGTAAAVQSFPSDQFTTREGKSLEITFIKHGSLLLNYNGKMIYVDPVSDYADYSLLPKADLILITHDHEDHLDPKAIGEIEQTHTILIANAVSRQKLGKGKIMKNGDHMPPLPGIEVEAVPAYNTTPGREKFHPRGRDNGYVLTLGGTRIYIAGDTEDIPEMQQLKAIDIAFLPVNQPYTMTVSQAVKAACLIHPRVFYPYHYGNTPVEHIREVLQEQSGIDVRIRPLQ